MAYTRGVVLSTAGPPSSWRQIASGSNNQRAFYAADFFTPSGGEFVYAMNCRMRRVSGSPVARLAIWRTSDQALLAYTTGFGVGSDGNYGAFLEWSAWAGNVGVANPAYRFFPGETIYVGYVVAGGTIEVGEYAAYAYSHIRRTVPSSLPTGPFGATTSETQSVPGWYMTVEPNYAPTVALSGPAENAILANANPTLSGSFGDVLAGGPYYDRMSTFGIEVRRVGDLAQMWQFQRGATTSERAAFAWSEVYAGVALANGGSYEWRARVFDDFGVPSDWTAWRGFAVGNLGGVDPSSASPTGKDEDGQVAYSGLRWQHPNATAMVSAQLQLLLNGALAHTSGEIAKAAANNALFSLSAAEVGVGGSTNPLGPGSYAYRVRGKDNLGAWSPWSAERAFSVNFPPLQPSNLRPVSGETVSSRPILRWQVADPDLDDVLGVGLISEVELTRPNGTVVTWQTNNADPATAEGYYQTTSGQVTTDGRYSWRVRGYDQSAGAAGFGPWSAPSIFDFAVAPIVTFTTPAADGDNVATSTPTFAFSVADGAAVMWRLQLYRANAPNAFYSTGQVNVSPAATNLTHQLPPGWLTNQTFYDAEATIWTAGGLVGTSLRRRFFVSYPSAADVAFLEAALQTNPLDVEATSVSLSWAQTAYPLNEFAGYVVRRRFAHEAPAAAVPIAVIRTPNVLGWVDHLAPPGDLIYGVGQLRRVGFDLRESDPREDAVRLVLTTPVIVSLLDPARLRLVVRHLGTGLSRGSSRPVAEKLPWGSGGKPVLIRAPEGYGRQTRRVSFTLLGDAAARIGQRIDAAAALMDAGHPCCYRGERERLFVGVQPDEAWGKRGGSPGTFEVTATVKEIAWQEAVKLSF